MNGAEFSAPSDLPDADPGAFLMALGRYLDGLNPDRRQVELRKHHAAIRAAWQELTDRDPAQSHKAAAHFPELRLGEHRPSRLPPRVREDETVVYVPAFPFQVSFPLSDPNVAPIARTARGTPTAAPALRFLACSQGANALPRLVAFRAADRRFWVRHQEQ